MKPLCKERVSIPIMWLSCLRGSSAELARRWCRGDGANEEQLVVNVKEAAADEPQDLRPFLL